MRNQGGVQSPFKYVLKTGHRSQSARMWWGETGAVVVGMGSVSTSPMWRGAGDCVWSWKFWEGRGSVVTGFGGKRAWTWKGWELGSPGYHLALGSAVVLPTLITSPSPDKASSE